MGERSFFKAMEVGEVDALRETVPVCATLRLPEISSALLEPVLNLEKGFKMGTICA